MPKDVTRRDVEQLVREGAQVVEVLPSEEYEDEHLPGAINIPLDRLELHGPERLDRHRPVIVYCFDAA
jgi:rhodanese-related sulfurtransferase